MNAYLNMSPNLHRAHSGCPAAPARRRIDIAALRRTTHAESRRRSDASASPIAHERGFTLVEVLIALIVLSIGILAIAQMFPAGARSQQEARMVSSAAYYVQQKAEELQDATSADPALSIGRHPPGSATEALGAAGSWKRFYQVDQLTGSLSNIRRVAITVQWNYMGSRAVNDTLYLRR